MTMTTAELMVKLREHKYEDRTPENRKITLSNGHTWTCDFGCPYDQYFWYSEYGFNSVEPFYHDGSRLTENDRKAIDAVLDELIAWWRMR